MTQLEATKNGAFQGLTFEDSSPSPNKSAAKTSSEAAPVGALPFDPVETNAVAETHELFEEAGLVLPPIPTSLKPAFRRIEEWCYATRDIGAGRMYWLGNYAEEVVAEEVDDYVAVSHSGHGGSYSINYHLVYGWIALFVQVGWGGGYTNNETCAGKVAAWFAKCGDVIEAAEGIRVRDRQTQAGWWCSKATSALPSVGGSANRSAIMRPATGYSGIGKRWRVTTLALPLWMPPSRCSELACHRTGGNNNDSSNRPCRASSR